MMSTPTTVSTMVTAVESDCCIVWVMLSMSFVTREISSPRCTLSKYAERQAVDLRLDVFAQLATSCAP